MELYGGGMVGKSNNYKLGGQIARSKRGRAHKVELEGLKQKAERDAERRGVLSKIGQGVRFVGNLAVPGMGDFFGTAVESLYRPKDYSGGKWGKNIRDDLTRQSKDFKSGVFERGLVGGLQTAIMPELYSGIKENLGQGFDWLKGLRGAGESAIETGTGVLSKTPATELMVGQQGAMGALKAPTFASKFGAGDRGLGLLGLKDTAPAVSRNLFGSFAPLGGGRAVADVAKTAALDTGLTFGDAFNRARGQGLDEFIWKGNPYHTRLAVRGGGMIPEMQMGGMIGEDPSMLEPPLPTPPRPMRPIERPARQAEPIAPTMGASPTMVSTPPPPPSPTVGASPMMANASSLPTVGTSPVSVTQPPPPPEQTMGASPMGETGTELIGRDAFETGASTGTGIGTGTGVGTGTDVAVSATTPTGQYGGYGTAISADPALRQMGMSHIVDDPRFKDYLKDLPQFSQGYRQQFGDIMAGGREAAMKAYTAQRLGGAGGGFAGAGAIPQAFQQGMAGLKSDIGRKRRGVVEGFQSDLLSAVEDIEGKAGFTFGQGAGGFDLAERDIQDLMLYTGVTRDEAERQVYQDIQGGSGGTRS